MTASIALTDLAAQHREIEQDVREGFERVLASASFIGGSDVGEFEREFASFCGARECIGVANGTDAIELILRGLGIGSGDEVLLPANTFIATAGAVHRAGATPVFVDCDDKYLLIDPDCVPSRLTPLTRAVIGVDLYGQIAPFDHLADILAGYDVAFVEDAAQSQGATRRCRPIGAHVAAAATSFYPGKNLGAYGDGGAVLTDDEELAADVRALANHGGINRYDHRLPGFNSRLDTLQAVVLRAKLRRLGCWNEARRRAARRYDQLLEGANSIRRIPAAPGNMHVWHLYVVRVRDRDRVLAQLHESGIAASIHYPLPLHLTDAFSWLGHGPGDFPVAEAASRTIISLPIHPHITYDAQARVCEVLLGAVG